MTIAANCCVSAIHSQLFGILYLLSICFLDFVIYRFFVLLLPDLDSYMSIGELIVSSQQRRRSVSRGFPRNVHVMVWGFNTPVFFALGILEKCLLSPVCP